MLVSSYKGERVKLRQLLELVMHAMSSCVTIWSNEYTCHLHEPNELRFCPLLRYVCGRFHRCYFGLLQGQRGYTRNFRVLETLKKERFYGKLSKYDFWLMSVSYFRHIV